jgi:hypothetical protein
MFSSRKHTVARLWNSALSALQKEVTAIDECDGGADADFPH